MGTNYYLRENACDKCGRSDEKIHIGKSSSGWCFGLHVIPEEGINSLEDWKTRFAQGGKIFDEYGREVSVESMLSVITVRGDPQQTAREGFDYEGNWAEPGPNGLLRHRYGHLCVGHGDGSWDLMRGTFS